MNFLFCARNITKHYNQHCALNNVSINVPKQSIFGLLGPNGAGKTTLIRIINQIIAPDAGELLIDNRPLKPDNVREIGYLPEERGLYKKMKVGEQAIYLAQLKGLSAYDAKKELLRWFDKFDLMAWWDKKVEELSKGMQQKVQFIITILHKPRLLIFDEPFSGFDPINANLLKQEIIALKNQGATIIFSTHNMESVEELCDHITLINRSENILSGSVHEIRKNYTGQLFQIETEDSVGSLETMLDQRFQVVETTKRNGLSKVKIRMKERSSSSDLLKQLIDHIHITSFNELIPSMNDIFIKHVTGSFPTGDHKEKEISTADSN